MSGSENPNSSPRYCPTPSTHQIPGSPASPPPQMMHHMQSQSMGSYYSPYHNSQSAPSQQNYYSPAQSSPNPGYYGSMNPHQAQTQYVQQQQPPQWQQPQQQHVHQTGGYCHSYVPSPQNYTPHSPQHSPHSHPQQQQIAVTGSTASSVGYDINLTPMASPSNHTLTQNHQQQHVVPNSDNGGQSSIMNLARFVNQNNTTPTQNPPMQQNLSVVNNNINIMMSGDSVSPRPEPRTPPVVIPSSIPALPTSTVLLSSSSISSSNNNVNSSTVATSSSSNDNNSSYTLQIITANGNGGGGGGGQTGSMMPVRLQNMAKGARTKASMRKLLLEQQSTVNSNSVEVPSENSSEEPPKKRTRRKPKASEPTEKTPETPSPKKKSRVRKVVSAAVVVPPVKNISPAQAPLPEPRKVEEEIAFALLDLKTGKSSPEKEKGKAGKHQHVDDSVSKSEESTNQTPGKNRKRKSSTRSNHPLEVEVPPVIDQSPIKAPAKGKSRKKESKQQQQLVEEEPLPKISEEISRPTPPKNRKRKSQVKPAENEVVVPPPNIELPTKTTPPRGRAKKSEKGKTSKQEEEENIIAKPEEVVQEPVGKNRKRKSPVKPVENEVPILPPIVVESSPTKTKTTPSRGRSKKKSVSNHQDEKLKVSIEKPEQVIHQPPPSPNKNRKRKSPVKPVPVPDVLVEIPIIPIVEPPRETTPSRGRGKKTERKSFPSPDITTSNVTDWLKNSSSNTSKDNVQTLGASSSSSPPVIVATKIEMDIKPTKTTTTETPSPVGSSVNAIKKKIYRGTKDDTDRKENETIMEVSLACDTPLPPLSHYLQFEYSQRNNYPPSVPSHQKKKERLLGAAQESEGAVNNSTNSPGTDSVKVSTESPPVKVFTNQVKTTVIDPPTKVVTSSHKNKKNAQRLLENARKSDVMMVASSTVSDPVKIASEPNSAKVVTTSSVKIRKESHRLLEARKNELMAELQLDQLNVSSSSSSSTHPLPPAVPAQPSLPLHPPKNKKDSQRSSLEARKNELMAELGGSTVNYTSGNMSNPPPPVLLPPPKNNRKGSQRSSLEARKNELLAEMDSTIKKSSTTPSAKNRKESHRLLEVRKNVIMAELNQLNIPLPTTDNKVFGQEPKQPVATTTSSSAYQTSSTIARAAIIDSTPPSTLQFIPALAKPVEAPSVFVKSVPLAAPTQSSSVGMGGKKQQGKKTKKGDNSMENKGKGQKNLSKLGPNLRVNNGIVKFYSGSDEEDVDVPLSKLRLERPNEKFDSSVPWLCTFCRLGPHAQRLGDLFGPYYINNANGQTPKETWMHQDCALWAGGVILVGVTVRGLDEAVEQANSTTCTICQTKGATIGCLSRKCPQAAHFPCAQKSLWKLDNETFYSSCNIHNS